MASVHGFEEGVDDRDDIPGGSGSTSRVKSAGNNCSEKGSLEAEPKSSNNDGKEKLTPVQDELA
jgi:hypothetical protein